ncbi:MAG: hypothetical protein PHG31_00815 [Candidatus Omnitrophica bacterium]|nr:hypothetical protein [Candidatus Omnitrophota bacterium]
MRIQTVIICVVALSFSPSLTMPLHAEVAWEDIGRGNTQVNILLVDEGNRDVILAGAGRYILRTDNSGKSWAMLYSIKEGARVNALVFGDKTHRRLYAATSKGLLYSHDGGRSWKTIFKGKNSKEGDCSSVAIAPYGVILGTAEGLFISYDNGRSWDRQAGKVGKCRVRNIACPATDSNYVYVTCTSGMFARKDNTSAWVELFIGQSDESAEEGAQESLEEDNTGENFSLRYLCIDEGDARRIFLASSRGVYVSLDKGKTWSRVPSHGLLDQDVQFLLHKKSQLFAVTRSGIFLFREKRWEEISWRLVTKKVNCIAMNGTGVLYAACQEGIFKAVLGEPPDDQEAGFLSGYLKQEPCIKQVQQAAMQYAEVEPEKILRWREQAQRKGWLPKITFGLNNDNADLWHWETGSTTKSEDDALRRGRDSIEWDISVSWDLSELIWNNDQTSIDVRSRLTTQLRDDVLDSVTKLYFERLRVKIDMDSLSLGDRKKRLEKELRIAELTASLDALTGGYFSNSISRPKP